jgi:hypothetical protein
MIMVTTVAAIKARKSKGPYLPISTQDKKHDLSISADQPEDYPRVSTESEAVRISTDSQNTVTEDGEHGGDDPSYAQVSFSDEAKKLLP